MSSNRVVLTSVGQTISLTATLQAVGQSVPLDATVFDADGAVIPGARVSWSSADPSIATVDENGLVIAVSQGTTRVTATSGGVSTYAVINVVLRQVATRITVTPSTATLESVGATVQLEVVVYGIIDAIIPDAQVTWSSSDESVAVVDADDLVMAVSNGDTKITANPGDASASADITVIQVASSLTITPPTATVRSDGQTARFEAAVYDAVGVAISDAPVVWSSRDPAVATVYTLGLATGVGVGTATITATSGEATGTATLTVTAPPPPPRPTAPDLVVSASINDDNPYLGNTVILSVTVRYRGNRPAAATTIRYYRTWPDKLGNYAEELDTDSVSGLIGSAISRKSRDRKPLVPFVPYVYLYFACVDAVTGESNTGNNCSRPVRVRVIGRPDLAIQGGGGDVEANAGGTFQVYASAVNRGKGNSGRSTLRYLFSLNDN